MLKLSKLVVFSFLLSVGYISASWGQQIQKGYFQSPVKPGVRNYLAGNFSELRPNHFHTGLDYKFGGVEGEPIYAVADGWVHRIKISSFGYGNVILAHGIGTVIPS